MHRPAKDVFISYRSSDRALAQRLYERLCQAGFQVWFDRHELQGGDDWYRSIRDGSDLARIVLPVLTPRWGTSDDARAVSWTKFEAYAAEHVIPTLFEGTLQDVQSEVIQAFQAVDLRDETHQEAWLELFERIRVLLQAPRRERRRFHNLPFQPNPFFVGREQMLLNLHERLWHRPTTSLTASRAQALAGMGGVGKSTLVREYAETFWRSYRTIAWIHAERPELITGQFAQLAVDLGLLPALTSNSQSDALLALRSLQNGNNLMILDNATDEHSIQAWIPGGGDCRALITSRFTQWIGVDQIPVDSLDPLSARELFGRRIADRVSAPLADTIVELLGYLPLAIELAASQIRRLRLSLPQYIELYRSAPARWLDDFTPGQTKYPQSLARSLLLAVEGLSPAARALLEGLAIFAAEPIPLSLIAALGEQLVAHEAVHPSENAPRPTLEFSLAQLADYSVLQFRDARYSLHRLIQAVLRDERHSATQRRVDNPEPFALRALFAVFPAAFTDTRQWAACEELFPHLQAVLTRLVGAPQFAPTPWDRLPAFAEKILNRAELESLAKLCLRASNYADLRGREVLAKHWARCAIQIARETWGPQHPQLAACHCALANFYLGQARYREAESLLRPSLEILLGDDCVESRWLAARCWTALGELLTATGQYPAAAAAHQRALALLNDERRGRPEEFPDDAYTLAWALAAAAETSLALGQWESAENLLASGLRPYEATSGESSLAVTRLLVVSAQLCLRRQRVSEARELLGRALQQCEATLGGDHAQTAVVCRWLGWVAFQNANYLAAESWFQRSSSTLQVRLGTRHPEYLRSAIALAEAGWALGKNWAIATYSESVRSWSELLGKDHPELQAVQARWRSWGVEIEPSPQRDDCAGTRLPRHDATRSPYVTWAHDLRLAGLPGRRLLPGLAFLAVVGASGAITAMVARVFLSAAGVLGQGAPTVGGSLIWSLLTLCGAGTGAALSVRFAQRRAARRRREFDRFLEDATVEMIRRMRGGHSLVSAMMGAGDGAAHQSPWASAQWNLLVEKTNLGVTLEDALNELQNLVGTPRLDGFVRLVLGQRQMGGDLAEMLAETVDCEDYPALGRLITKPTTATLTTS